MIRIIIADDHAIIRDGLKQIISFVPEMQVVGEAGDGDEVLQKVRTCQFEVLLLDMSMPGRSGIALIQQLHALQPALPILILSMHQESQYAVQAMRAGASGYISKNTASSQLIEGIRAVAKGETYVSPEISAKLIRQMHKREEALPHTQLTAREFQIFNMLVEGHAVNDIAKILSLSNKTISTHKAAILQKMDATTTTHLVHYALKHGLIDEA
ncbi:MAG TPA: response regulator transcription factor [Cellvibrio sp.]|uniref:DNA-binding response regulator n=1 Tax=Oxalicibacterium faecigallinarum TaxID=573741 RepID=A0A8J3AM05_9BURK|nr:response regulator transcription factor [Oxalicibacterium faecigallinarum]MDQ7968857.1 response regulator transcription factor [Oxalicibacterium faecigallinarum]GGI17142.1 DNA-binding response regulator [Oxalicibacterium faecigallinarum]